jgi:hypothetical protein
LFFAAMVKRGNSRDAAIDSVQGEARCSDYPALRRPGYGGPGHHPAIK